MVEFDGFLMEFKGFIVLCLSIKHVFEIKSLKVNIDLQSVFGYFCLLLMSFLEKVGKSTKNDHFFVSSTSNRKSKKFEMRPKKNGTILKGDFERDFLGAAQSPAKSYPK